MPNKSLAIISSYDEGCGNASYTYSLRKGFAEACDVTILPLNLTLLQNDAKELIEAGDRHIRQIADQLKNFDYVNIQFESGLYGINLDVVFNRLSILLDAAKNVVLTLHRVDIPEIGLRRLLYYVARRRRIKQHLQRFAFGRLFRKIFRKCKALSASKNIWVMVHTPKEESYVRDLFGFTNVTSYPLTFLFEEEIEAAVGQRDHDAFLDKYRISPDEITIGVFGYFGSYKGFETAIRSLRTLPSNHTMLLFGAQHPQSIKVNVTVDPGVKVLITEIEALEKARRKGPGERSAYERVRFMGSPDDPDFIEAIGCSDVVVLPYLEVGQGMSGVLALARELDANIVGANNLSFLEFRKLFGPCFRLFDIGNDIELAQRVVEVTTGDKPAPQIRPSPYTLRGNIRRHLELFETARG